MDRDHDGGMKAQPRRLLDLVFGFKTGVIKKADIAPRMQKKVERMAGEFSSEQLQDYVKHSPVLPAKPTGRETLRHARG